MKSDTMRAEHRAPLRSVLRRRGSRLPLALAALHLILSPTLVTSFLPERSTVVHRRLPRRSRSSSALPFTEPDAQNEATNASVGPSAGLGSTGSSSGSPGSAESESILRLRIADLEFELADARATLAARTEEVQSLRAAQIEHLAQISELTASLASAQREKESALTDLAASQQELSASLGQVAELMQKVNDAGGMMRVKDEERAEAEEKLRAAEEVAQQRAQQVEAVEREEEASVSVSASASALFTASFVAPQAEAEIAAEDDEGEEIAIAAGDADVGSSSHTSMGSATIPELNNWKLDGVSATGRVSGHPAIDDGEVIVTSPITNPSEAKEGNIVTTESGSRYKLGKPQFAPSPTDRDVDIDDKSSTMSRNGIYSTLDLDLAKTKLDLTGESVANGRYLLAGSPIVSKHGRSEIWSAYRSNGYGLPKGDALAIKISSNEEAMRREDVNYKAVTVGLTRGKFVRHIEFLPRASDSPPWSDKLALVMERGTGDMKSYVERYGALRGDLLRDAVSAAASCVNAVHASNLVWTDLKLENFVVVEDGDGGVKFRGIDLESAMNVGGNPVDYSPEACPPEFAVAFLEDGGRGFVLDFSYDVWSLGTLLYELATGRSLFEGKSPLEITKMLPDYSPDPSLFQEIADPKLADLISQCLQPDSRRRPSIAQIMAHPYLSSGFGPFRFG